MHPYGGTTLSHCGRRNRGAGEGLHGESGSARRYDAYDNMVTDHQLIFVVEGTKRATLWGCLMCKEHTKPVVQLSIDQLSLMDPQCYQTPLTLKCGPPEKKEI